MSRSTILRQFAAGTFLANAVPHGVAGVTGKSFPSPFARPPGRGLSSPVVNVIWSALNVGVGLSLRAKNPSATEKFAVGMGALAMSLFLSRYFGSVESAGIPRQVTASTIYR